MGAVVSMEALILGDMEDYDLVRVRETGSLEWTRDHMMNGQIFSRISL